MPSGRKTARQARPAQVLLLLLAVLGLGGCAASVGVQPNHPRETYAEISVSAISADDYSRFSRDVLTRFNLMQTFAEDPKQVLAFLHQEAENGYRNDLVFALAELNYFVGMRSRQHNIGQAQSHFLAAALYAHLYLLGKDWLEPPNPFERRFRIACDLYNNGLAEALTDANGTLQLAPARVDLPVGQFAYTLDVSKFHQETSQFARFVSTDRYGVRGLSRRNREAGLGAPIIAIEKKPEESPMFRTSPGTLLLRFDCHLQDIREGSCAGALELYSTFDHTEVAINDRTIPLERDLTAQMAYTIDQPYLQWAGFAEFLYGTGSIKTGVFPMQPYAPDKIPLVLVHGTFSSPIAWAEMVNTLRADPILARKYQIWNFFYDSGKRIGITGQELRQALTTLVDKVDPQGTNQALRQMVIIGHSQGGIVTRMMVTDSGDAFVRMATGKSLAELDLSEEDRLRIEREAVHKPFPFVSRVVFIATPHRGSFLSKNWVRTLVLKVIALPKGVMESTAGLIRTAQQLGVSEAMAQDFIRQTSLDVMAPDSPVLQTLAGIPVVASVKAHSIIAIDGDEVPPEGDDGVVEYTSAHLENAASEFVVRSGHSCQSHPLVIEEVRRILLAHLKEHQHLPARTPPAPGK